MTRILRESKPILHRQKCLACGYYSVHEAVAAGDRGTDRCTHCGHEVELAWNQELKAIFKNTEKFLKNMEALIPELRDLKNPGDHILID